MAERIQPMDPVEGSGPFDDAEYRFEPWWPGVRVILSTDGQDVRLAARDLSAPLASFPELRGVVPLVSGGSAALDGTLLVLDAEGRPDQRLLRERLAYPEVHDGTPALVVSDLLWAGDRDLRALPYRTRLDELGGLLRDSDWCMVGRGFVGEGLAVAAALESMGMPAMGARHLGSAYRSGPSKGAWLRLPLRPGQAAAAGRPTLALLLRLGL
ncbi:MAG TPA: hypothetical protein VFW86_01310 [Candidatus Limnocylindrales bacterium]|nr:hypothetical protein [Candidatus Limnocylindrales bacterium]